MSVCVWMVTAPDGQDAPVSATCVWICMTGWIWVKCFDELTRKAAIIIRTIIQHFCDTCREFSAWGQEQIIIDTSSCFSGGLTNVLTHSSPHNRKWKCDTKLKVHLVYSWYFKVPPPTADSISDVIDPRFSGIKVKTNAQPYCSLGNCL